MGIAKEMYDRTPLGEIGKAYPSSGDEALVGFQDVVAEFAALEEAGLIEITLRHPESMTGKKYIDLIQYRKLK